MPGIGIGLGLGMGVGKPQASLFDRVHQALFGAGEEGIYMPSVHESFLRGDLSQNAAGTIPVTAVGQSVGLWLDRSKGLELGPEKVTNGGFDTDTDWTKGEGWTISDGVASRPAASSYSNLVQSGVFTVGAVYEITLDVVATSGPVAVFCGVGNRTPNITTPGRKVIVAKCVGNDSIYIQAAGAEVACTLDNVSVREILGNHASQATSAARPVYRASPSRLDFDEVDDKLTATFASSLGEDCTVALSIPGVGASILTGQTIGTSYDITTDNCGIVIVDRALTTDEADRLTALLNASAGV